MNCCSIGWILQQTREDEAGWRVPGHHRVLALSSPAAKPKEINESKKTANVRTVGKSQPGKDREASLTRQFCESIKTFRCGKDFSQAGDKDTEKLKRSLTVYTTPALAGTLTTRTKKGRVQARCPRSPPSVLSALPRGCRRTRSPGPGARAPVRVHRLSMLRPPQAPPPARTRAPPHARPLPAAPTSRRCSRSPGPRAPRLPGPSQALGPGHPGAARSLGPASPCFAARLRGSRRRRRRRQLCSPGLQHALPGPSAGFRGARRGGARRSGGAAGGRGVAGDSAPTPARSPRERREGLRHSPQAPSLPGPQGPAPACGLHGYAQRGGAGKLLWVLTFHSLSALRMML